MIILHRIRTQSMYWQNQEVLSDVPFPITDRDILAILLFLTAPHFEWQHDILAFGITKKRDTQHHTYCRLCRVPCFYIIMSVVAPWNTSQLFTDTHRRSQKRKCLQLLPPVERDRRRNLQTVVTHHAGKDLSNKIVETCEDILYNLSSTDNSPSIITTLVANNFKAIFKNKQILYCNVCL